MKTATWDKVQPQRQLRTLSGGQPGWVTDFIPGSDGGAQAFLVEQSPHSVVNPHFHLQDQFQVIVNGSGLFGRRPILPVQVHYANRHTGYGPITAGEHGLSYLTLRRIADKGAWYLPESRPHLDTSIPKRHATSEVVAPRPANQDPLTSPRVTVLLAAGGDGPAAWHMSFPGGAEACPPRAIAGADHFLVVTSGTLELDAIRLEALGVAFIPNDESPRVKAGRGGAELVVLQFPAQGARPLQLP